MFSRRSHCVRNRLVGLLIGLAVLPLSILAGSCFAAERDQLIKGLLDQVQVKRGVCLVLGRDGAVAIDLATQSELLVAVREPNAKQATELRELAEQRGLGMQRLVVHQGGFRRLPFADNVVDAVVATNAGEQMLKTLPVEEVLRVLRPGGRALIGKAVNSQGPSDAVAAIADWAKRGETIRDVAGEWVQFEKEVPVGRDNWSHWEKAPDNNPVSGDTLIRAPYMTQFMAGPLYIGMPSITTVAGGRTFLAVGHIAHHRREWNILNRLIVRNGYNGIVLWDRKLPEGYLVHRSAFIATDETFHMIDGDHCLLLDAATGKEKGQIRIPGLDGDWKWMVLQDDILYVLAGKPEPGAETVLGDRTFGGWSWADLSKGYYGKRIPYGFGDALASYDLKKQVTLWVHKEDSLIDSRGMALRDGKLYVYCPDRHFRALAADDGEVLWTNGGKELLELIEQPGKKLTSTPGFRTMCLVVATPKALIVQGQTRNNVVAISTEDGYKLWTKPKITNNPNAIYVDGNVILGVGPGGSHVVVDPVSGEVKDNLKFNKRACTRLTASGDSFFCRGEGTLRYDRASKKLLIDGAQRPACNDGAIPANGLLYLGPWQCDCNLSLIGNIAKCSAGSFRFDIEATDEERLTTVVDSVAKAAAMEITTKDWPTFRGDNQRSSSSPASPGAKPSMRWSFSPEQTYTPTAPTAAGGLIYVSGSDGAVRAFEGASGALKWRYQTSGVVKFPPTIWEGRAFVGSGDGFVYCLEAASGRLLWRFRAAPVERNIVVYGSLSSTWPVHSGVLVHEGVAYFAAGIIDQDGTYIYALDAETGRIQWQNNSSGHLNAELRKGVSVQGNLSILGNRLLLAGGNQVSPATFNLKTGECLSKGPQQGQPKANNGQFVGVMGKETVVAGGRILHSAVENVSNKNSFVAITPNGGIGLNQGGIPPAWNDDVIGMVNFKHGKLACCEIEKTIARLGKGLRPKNDRNRRFYNLYSALSNDGAVRWQTDMNQPSKFEVVSMAICPDVVVAVFAYQQRARARIEWSVAAFDMKNGAPRWRQSLSNEPLPGGLLVDRDGRVVITALNGGVACLAGP